MKKYLSTLFDHKIIYTPLLLLFPTLFLIVSWMYANQVGYYHLFVTDPEYAYLFNGLNILHFKLPDQVNGPGTPLQVYSAIVTKIVYMFRGGESLNTDVFQNPDLYLFAINRSIIIFTCISLFFTGLIVSKVTKNIFSGFFIQLMPFLTWQIIDLMRRIMVENFVIIGVFLLILLVYHYMYKSKNEEKSIDKYVIFFSIIIGFISASKLMYLPIAIIPFLLLKGVKRKSLYVVFSIAAFSFFAYAIFGRWVAFRDWYWQNFIHSGQYGAGSTSIIEMTSFKANLNQIFAQDSFLLKGVLIILIGAILYQIPQLRVKQKSDNQYKTLIGIIITIMVMIFLVAKQMKYYYLTTALLLLVPGIHLLILIFIRPFKNYYKLFIIVPLSGLVLFHAYKETKSAFIVHESRMQVLNKHLDAYEFVKENYKDVPTLVIPEYYGVPFKEYGLFFGMAWCGSGMANEYAKDLNKLFPYVSFYHTWNNLFNQWGNSYSFIDYLKKNENIIIYSGDINLERSIESKFTGINRKLDTHFKDTVEINSIGARIYEISYDTSYLDKPFSILCDAEHLNETGDKYIGTENIPFGDGNTVSSDYAYSGKYSAKLDQTKPYGYTAVLSEVKTGENYKITAMFKGDQVEAGIAAMTSDPNYFFVNQMKKMNIEDDWVMITLDLSISDHLNNKDLKIFCWNPGNSGTVYVDDFRVEKLE